MNAERAIRMIFNMILRRGMRRLSQGQKPSEGAKQAQQSMRLLNRFRRF